MNVIWETDELKVIKISKQPEEYLLTDDPRSIMRDAIKLSQNELTTFCLHWLDLQGYDITKPEPEIAPCPFCGGECYTWNPEENEWSVACHDCTYNSGCADSESAAIRLHNLIAGKGE
jgi:hypothetical protein